MQPPTIDLEVARNIAVDTLRAAQNDRKEPLFLWDDIEEQLKQITDAELRSRCFPRWRPPHISPVAIGQPVILSYGLGADSTALLFKYLLAESNEERGFPLENLVVITSLVGREWDETIDKVQRFVLPLLRQHNVLTIQCGRMSDRSTDGWILYECSRQPKRLYQDVAQKLGWTLDRHLLQNGIVPQRRKGARTCTLRFKGEVIDAIVRHLFAVSPMATYKREIGHNADETKRAERSEGYGSSGIEPTYHVGYNADETKRAKTDRSMGNQGYAYEIGYNADEESRISEAVSNWRKQVFSFPLISKYKMGREAVDEFNIVTIVSLYGVSREEARIRKSSCTDCPFSCSSGGRPLLLKSYWTQPEEGANAAFIEQNALALNPTQFLYSSKFTVLELLEKDGNTAALQAYRELIASIEDWAVYAVRRIWKHPNGLIRQTDRVFQGTRQECQTVLKQIGEATGIEPVFLALSWRVITIARTKDIRPSVEETFLVTPAYPIEKQGRITKEEFALKWKGLTGERPTTPCRTIELIGGNDDREDPVREISSALVSRCRSGC
ncbi:MAG: hypothetical protein AAFQ89_15605 [Cyanobacteria bacterium J06626_18]